MQQNFEPTLVALGANLPSEAGAPETTIALAIKEISSLSGRGVRASRLYDTPAFPDPLAPAYVNAVAMIWSDLPPAELLLRLHAIETRYGRQRQERWGGRSLDLDLLGYGDRILPDATGFEHWRALAPQAQRTLAPKELVLPHPRLHERGFVLVPMADVAPDWRHPVLGRTVAEMLASLPEDERAAIRPRPRP